MIYLIIAIIDILIAMAWMATQVENWKFDIDDIIVLGLLALNAAAMIYSFYLF